MAVVNQYATSVSFAHSLPCLKTPVLPAFCGPPHSIVASTTSVYRGSCAGARAFF